jgi:hypothetical protein
VGGLSRGAESTHESDAKTAARPVLAFVRALVAVLGIATRYFFSAAMSSM